MKKQLILTAMVLALTGAALAQMAGLMTVRGKANDTEGKAYTSGIVRLVNIETGRKYELKIDNKGQYMQVGVPLGKYDATLIVDGKELFTLHGINPSGENGEAEINFDLKKEAQMQGASPAAAGGQAPAASTGKQAPPPAALTEQQKQENAKIESENAKIRSVNQMFKDADAAVAANNLEQAITIMTQASQTTPNQPLVWIKLAELQAKAQKWEDEGNSLTQAIKTSEAQPPDKQNKEAMGAMHNNLGSALLRQRKFAEAGAEFNTAAQVNPTNAGMYYTNAAIVFQNAGKVDESVAAADKAIAADPQKADAYYWKGLAMLSKGVTDTKTGKTTYPAGASEALQKYMELAPDGKHATEAKALLEGMGEKVDTQYKAGKKSPK